MTSRYFLRIESSFGLHVLDLFWWMSMHILNHTEQSISVLHHLVHTSQSIHESEKKCWLHPQQRRKDDTMHDSQQAESTSGFDPFSTTADEE